MRICWHGFLGKSHSWSFVAQNFAKQLKSLGHTVGLFSTNGLEFLPESLRANIVGYVEENSNIIQGELLSNDYDLQLSYTSMKNFPIYLNHGLTKRLGIWCYEFEGKNVIPSGFIKNYQYCDYLLPPSNHAKQVFLDSGFLESKMVVLPHGYGVDITINNKFVLKTNKNFKFLSIIGQPHLRKNISGMLEAWGKAFSKKDDVVWVLKIKAIKQKSNFDVDVDFLLKNFKEKYPNHAEIIVLRDFISDLTPLYNACDALYSLSLAESFLIPALDGLAMKKIVISSNNGGNTDFCTSSNSLLVEGKKVRADAKMLYWDMKANAVVFKPNVDSAVEALRKAVYDKDKLLNLFDIEFESVRKNYSWEKVTSDLLKI